MRGNGYKTIVLDFGDSPGINLLIEVRDVRTGEQLFLKTYLDPKEARAAYEKILVSDDVEKWPGSESFYFREHPDKIIAEDETKFPENFTYLGWEMFSESPNRNAYETAISKINDGYNTIVMDFGNYSGENLLIEVRDIKTGRRLFLKKYVDPIEARVDYDRILRSNDVERWPSSESFLFYAHPNRIIAENETRFPENFSHLGMKMFPEPSIQSSCELAISEIELGNKKYKEFLNNSIVDIDIKYRDNVADESSIPKRRKTIWRSRFGDMMIRVFSEKDNLEFYDDETHEMQDELLRLFKWAAKDILTKKIYEENDDSKNISETSIRKNEGKCPKCDSDMTMTNGSWFCIDCGYRTDSNASPIRYIPELTGKYDGA